MKSSVGPSTEPVACSAWVMPLMVSSPSSWTLSPSIFSSSEEKVISGWLSASKNSALIRCAARFASLTSTEATWAAPRSLPSTSVAVTSSNELRNDETTYPIENVTAEWTGVKLQVPARRSWGETTDMGDLLVVDVVSARGQRRPARHIVAQATNDLHDVSRHAHSRRLI